MGNAESKQQGGKEIITDENTIDNFIKKIDIIAANYATTLHLDDFEKFKDQNKCNELVVLTADKIAKHLKFKDIVYLKQRTEKGQIIDEKSSEKILYLSKKDLETLDESNTTKKRRLCNGIAKFYVKIAQLYAAVVKVINPKITFQSEITKDTVVRDLNLIYGTEERLIPKGYNYKSTQFSLCQKRIENLTGEKHFFKDTNKKLNIKPVFCDQMTLLREEPGIIELEELFKDEYDYDNGVYKMSNDPAKRKLYMDTYKAFYKAFTHTEYKEPEKTDESKGIYNLPKFSDIPLRQFGYCNNENVKKIMEDGYVESNDSSIPLFVQYAKELKDLIQNVESKQVEILKVLNSLFKFIVTNETEYVMINPNLNEEELDKIVLATRELIFKLYVDCQTKYTNIFNLYTTIVKTKQMEQVGKELNQQIII